MAEVPFIKYATPELQKSSGTVDSLRLVSLGLGAASPALTALALGAGSSAAVSAASTMRFRYNETTEKAQVSLNGADYEDISTGGGAAGTYIEEVSTIVTTGTNSGVSFTGLNGDTDGAYLIVGMVRTASAPGAFDLELRPNGLAPSGVEDKSLRAGISYNSIAGIASENDYQSTSYRVANFQSDTGLSLESLFVCWFFAHTDAYPRMSLSQLCGEDNRSPNGQYVTQYDYSTFYQDALGVSNVTSIDLTTTVASVLASGCHFSLYKVPMV